MTEYFNEIRYPLLDSGKVDTLLSHQATEPLLSNEKHATIEEIKPQVSDSGKNLILVPRRGFTGTKI
jgi:hypothetical protein